MNKLKAILKEQGRTQVFLSTKINKTSATINLWCRNVVQPSVPDLYKISDILEIPVAELLVEKEKLKKLV